MNTLLVADDLTGATDAGVQFRKAGLRTTVWLEPAAAVADADSDVTVVDMDSRAAQPSDAYAKMRAFLQRLEPTRPGRIVKKMDSTLRGNPGPEVRAMLDALPDAFAIVAPAYPKNHRTSPNGVLLVDGVSVEQTDFGRDLFSPVREPRIAAHFSTPHVTLTLDVVRAGTAEVARAIDQARSRGVRLAIADVETDADLHALAAAGEGRDDLLWVGSAGLVEALPHPAPPSGAPREETVHVDGPVLFLLGSISAMTQRQIDDFAASGAGPGMRVDPIAVLEHGIVADVERAAAALAHGADVVFALDGDRDRVEAALAWGRARGLAAAATSRALLTAFIGAAEPLVSAAARGAVVLSGGDVARAFCGAHGVYGLTLLAEAAPGIPVSRAIGADLLLVTKAGGFGTPGTYRDILTTLHSQVTA